MPDGFVPLNVKVTTPFEGQLAPRMARNDARNLPEAIQTKSCIIVGSGPSARHEALWKRLEENPDITTVACNGALKLFQEHNTAPHIWTCCDPQDETIDFIPENPPALTDYYIATKCPEALFDRLDKHFVRPWRLGEPDPHAHGKFHVPTAVSITLVTMNLMRFLGYHRFETYGWDCCYLENKHHATHQPEPEGRIPLELRDQQTQEVIFTCETTPQWVAELNDACLHAHNYNAMGYEIVVHGPGLVGRILRDKGLVA